MRRFISVKKAQQSLEVIGWFVLVFLLGGTPFATINTGISNIVLPIAVIPMCAMLRKRTAFSTSSGLYVVLVLAVLATAIVNSELFIRPHYRLIACLTIALYIVNRFQAHKIKALYLNWMFYVTLASFAFYFLANNTNFLSVLPKVSNVNNRVYAIGIIYNYIIDIPERNSGCFWEPGIFASYLTIAIVFASDNVQKNWKKIVVFILGILTAKSSAGYALLFVTIPFVLMRNKQVSGIKKVLYFFMTFIVIILAINMDAIIIATGLSQNPWIAKLLTGNLTMSSRYTALVHNLEVFSRFPIFGAGYNYVIDNQVYCCDISTSTYLMSIYGVLGILFTFVMIAGPIRCKSISIYSKALYVLIMLMIFNKETHIFILLTWVLGFTMIKETELSENATKNDAYLNNHHSSRWPN